MGEFVTENVKKGVIKETAGLKPSEPHRIHWPAFDGECEVRPVENM
jgi:hypothetical protein